MAPALCTWRHWSFVAASSPSAPETRLLSAGGIPWVCRPTRVQYIQQHGFDFIQSRQWLVLCRNNTPRTKWHSQLLKKWGGHLWSHPQACLVSSLSGVSLYHQVHLPPLWELCVITSAVCLSPKEGSWACVCHIAMCSAAAKTWDQLVYSFYTVQKCY